MKELACVPLNHKKRAHYQQGMPIKSSKYTRVTQLYMFYYNSIVQLLAPAWMISVKSQSQKLKKNLN